MLRRRSAPWTDLPTCSTWGEAAGKRREDLGHHPPHPPHARDDRMTTTLSRSIHLRPTNGHGRGQDPPRGQSSSHSLGTTTPGPSGWQRNRTLGMGPRKDSIQKPHSSVRARKGEEQQVDFNRGCNLSRAVIRFKHPPGRTILTQVSMRRSGGGARAVTETLQGISSGSGM